MLMEESIVIVVCLVFSSCCYLLLRQNIRKHTKELLEFVEREGAETRKKIQLIFHHSEQKVIK